MCTTCGCDDEAAVRLTTLHGSGPGGHDHHPDHHHDDGHGQDGHDEGSAAHTHTVVIEQRVLAKNDALAADNRAALRARGLVMLNLMSSPGSGKTTLLERTIADLGREWPIVVLEGDQETTVDAERITAAGARSVQVNTGAGCHLDAGMVARGLTALDPPEGALVVVENVGNLVCPALFDLGEDVRVVVVSTPEGDEKPLKYPNMFAAADLVVLTKTDLLPHVPFDVARFTANLRSVNPGADLLTLSVLAAEGLPGWYARLRSYRRVAAGAP